MKLSIYILAAGMLYITAVAAFDARNVAVVTLDEDALAQAGFAPLPQDASMSAQPPGVIEGASVDQFLSSDKRLAAGYSKYKKITLRLNNWPVDEIMFILEGRVEITDAKGTTHTYGPGDAFVMPKGFSGTWRQLSDIKKMQITYTPP